MGGLEEWPTFINYNEGPCLKHTFIHTHSLNVILNPGNNGSSDELLSRMKPFKEECILKIVDIYKGLSIFTFILAYASYSHKTIVSCFVKTGLHVQSFFHKEKWMLSQLQYN